MILGRARASIVVRTTLQALGITAVTGILVLGFGGGAAVRGWERTRQRESLEALLDVVGPSASAACFADDGVLADQVVRGLIGTATVQSARIRTLDRVLAEASRRAPKAEAPHVSRPLASPFAPDSILGELVLFPDPAETERQAAHTAGLFRRWSVGVLAILAGILALTVHQVITGPLAILTRKLHALDAEAGGRLEIPRGHERDELGLLVGDVNALVERMLEAVWKEQALSQRLLQDSRKAQGPAGDVEANLLVVRDDGALETWTPGVVRLLGLEAAPPLPGIPMAALFGDQGPQAQECLDRCGAGPAFTTLRRPDPSGLGHRWLHLAFDRIGPDWCQGVLSDVTSYRDAPGAGGRLEVRDALTGALNRLGAEHALEERLATGTRGLGVVLLVLDGLEEAARAHGPGAREELLKQASDRLAAGIRRWDLLARLEVSTFLIVLDLLEDPEAGLRVGNGLVERMSASFRVSGGGEARVTASAGLALRRAGDEPTRRALLRRADLALAEARGAGGGCCRLAG